MIRITTCDKCKSQNIKELNPEQRDVTMDFLCKVDCECIDCNHKFTINTYTTLGMNCGVLY